MSKIIEVRKLYKSYGKVNVLKGVSFEVSRGTVLALLGPNGAGKTTIVRILSTLLAYDSGTVKVGRFDLSTDADNIRRIIGLTGQAAAVDELLTGRENLVMMGMLYRLTKRSATERAHELLDSFDLMDAADRPVKTYSGGMRRRLDLAVSLIAEPPLVFLDEPTTGLDPRSRKAMWKIIRKLVAGGTTILLTTQYLDEADQLADNIIVIDKGRVIAEGTSKQLKDKIGNDILELTFKDEKVLAAASKLIKVKGSDTEIKELKLCIPVKNANKDVHGALELLSKARIKVASISIHKPTLDDVFLSVTEGED